jgi:hypothetical protein
MPKLTGKMADALEPCLFLRGAWVIRGLILYDVKHYACRSEAWIKTQGNCMPYMGSIDTSITVRQLFVRTCFCPATQ